MPVKTSQNIRGIITDEQHNVYDNQSGIKRMRLTVVPLNGDKTRKEWGDYYNPVNNRLDDICMASGTAFVSMAKGANTDDDRKNIAWHLLPPNMVNSIKRDADRADAYYRNLKTMERKFDHAFNNEQILRAKLKQKDIEFRTKIIEFNDKCDAVVSLQSQVDRLMEEVRKQENIIYTQKLAIEHYKKMAGMPGSESLDIDKFVLKKTEAGVNQITEKGRAVQVPMPVVQPPKEKREPTPTETETG
jgi:hypothetical protein